MRLSLVIVNILLGMSTIFLTMVVVSILVGAIKFLLGKE